MLMQLSVSKEAAPYMLLSQRSLTVSAPQWVPTDVRAFADTCTHLMWGCDGAHPLTAVKHMQDPDSTCWLEACVIVLSRTLTALLLHCAHIAFNCRPHPPKEGPRPRRGVSPALCATNGLQKTVKHQQRQQSKVRWPGFKPPTAGQAL